MQKFDHLNVIHTGQLPSPRELTQELPAAPSLCYFIESSRQQIRQILENRDPRLLLIVGPCSIHDITAAKEYAIKLHELSKEVSDTFYIVMRAYFEKPRTSRGWKGLLYDPLLNSGHDIATGLRWTRQLLLEFAELGVPVATEFLDPVSANYFADLISWGCIGARTAASQTHRQMASGLPMPVAFKNSTDGNIDIAINGIINGASPHTFIAVNDAGKVSKAQTVGNSHGHLVLRGGKGEPNYDPKSIAGAIEKLQRVDLLPHLLVDCSHDNAYRQHDQQPIVFQSVIHQVMEGNSNIRGLLVESNLFAGSQPLASAKSDLRYGVSITDPCLDWATTEQLIRWGRTVLKKETENVFSEYSIHQESFPHISSQSSI